ncbi:MAG: hypothetical protein QNK23_08425 [Crocinitomicaceae bacterium]|nr:hypothetical protein [Crocinitomicaceae bacterium]
MKNLVLYFLILVLLASCSRSQEEQAFYDVLHGTEFKIWHSNYDCTNEDYRVKEFIVFLPDMTWDGGPVECSQGEFGGTYEYNSENKTLTLIQDHPQGRSDQIYYIDSFSDSIIEAHSKDPDTYFEAYHNSLPPDWVAPDSAVLKTHVTWLLGLPENLWGND